jgi:hypothetical protein
VAVAGRGRRVARAQPAVGGERLRGGLRVAPVARGDQRAGQLQLAGLPRLGGPVSVMPKTVVSTMPRAAQPATSAVGTGEPPTAATNGRSGASANSGSCSTNW